MALIRNMKRMGANAFALDEDGATAIEYGLIVALLAIALIGSITAMSQNVSQTFETVSTEFTDP